MSRSSRRNARLKSTTSARQISEVQGPQVPGHEPQMARIETQADLAQKYLGRGLVGFGPSLEVLQTKTADELLCKHGYDLYRRMLMDSEVDASVDVLIQSSSSQPVNAIPGIDPGKPGFKQAQELADFANYAFQLMHIDDWRKDQMRTALSFGNAVSEVDWDVVESGPWKDHLVICRLRAQRPEDYGYITDRWGTIYGVAPLGQAMGLTFPLGNLIPLSGEDALRRLPGAVPRFKLAIWSWDQKGVDPRGTSILIPAYIPWWSKQRAIEEWSCWLGRYSQPSIWATPGPDALPVCVTNPNGSQTITQPTEALLSALLNFKSASVLALPFGSKVELLSVTGGAGPFLESISAFNREITRGILGQHLATSEGGHQSRAAADIHAIILRQFINSLRRYIARMLMQDIVRPLIEANYGDVGELMPIVDLGDGDGWLPTVTEIAVLMQAGYFSTDQLVKIDKLLGLPVRETMEPAGPAAASAYYAKDTATPPDKSKQTNKP